MIPRPTLEQMLTMSRAELTAIARQRGLHVERDWKKVDIANNIAAFDATLQPSDNYAPDAVPQNRMENEVVVLPQDVLAEALEDIPGVVLSFDAEGNWHLQGQTQSDSGSMTVPLRIIRMIAQNLR